MDELQIECETGVDNRRQSVADKFCSNLRVLFNQILEGSRQYETLHSVTAQIEQNYHGRFAVELIQNANDAMEDHGRVRFERVRRGDLDWLYVANQGRPFAEKDFENICDLGLSDKDPSRDIGNKGLGFRSVLEVTTCPRVYSRSPESSAAHGYCFQFGLETREIIWRLLDSVSREGSDADKILSEFLAVPVQLYPDGTTAVQSLRVQLARRPELVERVPGKVQVYTYPRPASRADETVLQLWAEGFATVVVLPLDRPGAATTADVALRAIGPHTLIFLRRTDSIELAAGTAPDAPARTFKRRATSGIDNPATHEVLSYNETTGVEESAQRFVRAETVVAGAALVAAQSTLPSAWKPLARARVSLAVEVGAVEPPLGSFAIGLPTEVKTGSAVWVDAPFYGDISRKHIDFELPLNKLLLRNAAEFLPEFLRIICAGQSLKASVTALAAVDFRLREASLARAVLPVLGAGEVAAAVGRTALVRPFGADGTTAELLPLREVRHAPRGPKGEMLSVLTAELLARHVSLPSAEYERLGAAPLLRRVCETFHGGAVVSWTEVCNLLDNVAAELRDEVSDGKQPPSLFRRLYEDLRQLVPSAAEKEKLLTKGILLDSTLELHRQADSRPIVFDQPQRLTEDTGVAALVADMPAVLGAHIRFLHDEAIERTAPGKARSASMDLLRGSPPLLVREFELKDLVNDGILRCYGKREIGEDDYRALLRWAYQLWSITGRTGTASGANWNQIRVPTRAGWVAAWRTYFSAGWDGDRGRLLEEALPRDTLAGSARAFLLPPADFLHAVGAPPGLAGSDSLGAWLAFLRDGPRVHRSPRVLVFPEAQNKDKSAFHCWGSNYRLQRHGLKNIAELPTEAWERYLTYLESLPSTTVSGLIQGSKRFDIERYVTLDGISQITPESGVAYLRLVIEAIGTYKAYFGCTIRREDTGVPSQIRSTLATLLQAAPWLPAKTANEAIAMRDASNVLLIDPSDLARAAMPPMTFDLLPHIPRECASSVPLGTLAQEIGLRSPDQFTRADGIRWLAWYQAHRPEGAGSIWRRLAYDLLEKTSTTHTPDPAGHAADCPWGRVLVDAPAEGASHTEKLWQPSVSPDHGDGPVFLPNEPVLANQLRGSLPLVAMSGRHQETLRLIRWRFGEGAAQLVSDLEMIPAAVSGAIDTAVVDGSPALQDRSPWLIRAIVTILALGRPHQRMAARNLRDVARRLSMMRIVVVDGLDVRVRLPGGGNVSLARKVFAWASRAALVVDSSAIDDFRLLLDGMGQYIEDQDVAQSSFFRLHRFAKNGLRNQPTDEELTDAFLDSGFDVSQAEDVRRHLHADAEWVLQRLIPGLFALPTVGKVSGEELMDVLQSAFDPDEPVTSIAGAWLRFVSTPLPEGLDRLVSAALSDAPVAFVARVAFDIWGVNLESWNIAARKVAPASAGVCNAEARSLMLRLYEQLLPAARALLREHLVGSGCQGRYRTRTTKLEQSPECPEAALATWTPSIVTMTMPIAAAAAGIGPESPLPAWAAELLPRETEIASDVIRRLTSRGLAIREDEDAVFRANVLTLTPQLDLLQLSGLARCVYLGKEPVGSLVVQDARSLESQVVRDELDSLLSFLPLESAQIMAWLGRWWVANGLVDAVDVLPDVPAVTNLVEAWGITPTALERYRKLREELRSGIRRAANTREILGSRYEIPDGGVYVGLRTILDDRLNPAVGGDVDPSAATALGLPPEPAVAGGRGSGGSGVVRGGDDLAGAVGEYVAFTVVRRLSRGRIRETAWKSGNRRHFTDDGVEGDDFLGYDFEFTLGGRRYQVEVKSTKSHRPSQVQLGPSEVRAANEALASDRVTWQIWLITDVLTDPQVTVLANPYALRSRDQFRIEGLGARIRFELRGD